ncbi:MAG: lysine-2,3-aminomutase-like protein [Pseudomonadales bacterium]
MSSSSDTVRSTRALVERGLIATDQAPTIERVASRYAVAISKAVIDTIDVDDARDPVALQYVPSSAELEQSDQELQDPIGDHAHSPLPGLVHRYPDRVLLKPTLVCPVYCRFCFRREMVGHHADKPLTDPQLDAIANYIAARPQIWEVIVSGGDPLAMSPRRIGALIDRLRSIRHVKVLRWHSRVPVVTPERVTAELAELLASATQTSYIMVHANHANEFSAPARQACKTLIDAGNSLMSQTVLLRGINDNVDTLSMLMRTFVEQRITPYYLHHPDLAPGTAHFRVPLAKGQRLMRALRGRYSGLCQPTYVVDIPGGAGKSPIDHQYLAQNPDGGYQVQDYQGQWHDYSEADGDSGS